MKRNRRFVPSDADPRGPVDFLPGRFELAFRYSRSDIDRDLFDGGLTTFGISTQEVRTLSAELNWYDRGRTRVGLGFVRTIADQELGTFGDTDRDSTYFLRVDFLF